MDMFAKVPGMTPARFDFLYLISKGTSLLVNIRKKLGLRRQTTWVMMERLVELKLLTKKIVIQKFAQKLVRLELTDEGRARIRLALKAAFNVTIVMPALPPAITEATAPETVDAMYQEAVALAAQRRAAAQPPKISGREVGRLYTEFARRRTHRRKGRKRTYLDFMEETIEAAHEMARLLGDTTWPIYRVDYRDPGPEVPDEKLQPSPRPQYVRRRMTFVERMRFEEERERRARAIECAIRGAAGTRLAP
jgi:DNA-binding MarR family transcriptional regulator